MRALGKPLLAVLLTHGHPDHYNGVALLIEGQQVPVVATAAVDRVIRENDAAKEQQWKPMFGGEWPARRAFPSRIVADGETVTFGGVSFTVHALGPGESHADSYWVVEGGAKLAFIGDVVLNGVHAYVTDGHTTAWLANLARLEKELAGYTLYPGHGASGSTELLAEQRRYLEAYRAAVRRLAGGRPALTNEAKAALLAEMKRILPTDRLEFLVGLGADAVAAELASP